MLDINRETSGGELKSQFVLIKTTLDINFCAVRSTLLCTLKGSVNYSYIRYKYWWLAFIYGARFYINHNYLRYKRKIFLWVMLNFN